MGIKTEFNDSEVNRWFIKYTETEGRSGVIRRLLSWAHFSSGLKKLISSTSLWTNYWYIYVHGTQNMNW